MMNRLKSLTILVLVLFVSPKIEAESKYVVEPSTEDTVIVFVHGVLGSADSTWRSKDTYWPELLGRDSTFADVSVYVVDYPSTLWANYSIDELADSMRLNLKAHGVDKHRRIVFVAHSMGGLVTRAFLLKNRELAAKTVFAYFYSTPTTGSQIASIGRLVLRNAQLEKMKPMKSDDFLADQLRQWLSAELSIPTYCAYEKQRTFGIEVVSLQSASALCNKALDPLDYNHIDIVKPASENDQQYLAFKAAFGDEFENLAIQNSHVEGLQAVLLKLNETQFTKSEYLFPQMDAYVANPTEANWAVVRATASQLLSEIDVATKEAMKVDASFVDLGDVIVQITDSTITTIGREFAHPFVTSRKEWNGRAFELKRITEEMDAPTPAEVRTLSDLMKERFERLHVELIKLIQLAQERV